MNWLGSSEGPVGVVVGGIGTHSHDADPQGVQVADCGLDGGGPGRCDSIGDRVAHG